MSVSHSAAVTVSMVCVDGAGGGGNGGGGIWGGNGGRKGGEGGGGHARSACLVHDAP